MHGHAWLVLRYNIWRSGCQTDVNHEVGQMIVLMISDLNDEMIYICQGVYVGPLWVSGANTCMNSSLAEWYFKISWI